MFFWFEYTEKILEVMKEDSEKFGKQSTYIHQTFQASHSNCDPKSTYCTFVQNLTGWLLGCPHLVKQSAYLYIMLLSIYSCEKLVLHSMALLSALLLLTRNTSICPIGYSI